MNGYSKAAYVRELHRTTNAILFEVKDYEGGGTREVWIPQSQIASIHPVRDKPYIMVAEWIKQKHNLKE
jgi:hypothetical protein